MPTYNPIALSRTASDTDASTFFAACVTAGTTLSAGQQSAIQLLVQGFKQTGLWTKMTAVYPFIGGTAGTHAINLKTPGTYNITWGGTVTHNGNGITGNGSSGYGDTGIIPSSVLSLNSTHISVYCRTNTVFSAYEMGCIGGARITLDTQDAAGVGYASLSNAGDVAFSVPDSLGIYVVNRKSSASFELWKRVRKLVSATASTSLPTVAIALLARASSGSPSGFSNKNLAFSSIGSGLTDSDAINLSTLVQAYQSSLGRAV